MQQKIVLWGIGKIAEIVMENIGSIEEAVCVVAVVDSDSNKWGRKFHGHEVQNPDVIASLQYDHILIASTRYFGEIKEQLQAQYGVHEELIEDLYYVAKVKIMHRYIDTQDEDAQEILTYLEKHRLHVFNYPFKEKYMLHTICVSYDETARLYYVEHNGKRMYMARHFDTEEKVREYYNSICIEQDESSPHRYMTESFGVKEGDVIVDVGVAEGNFSLDVIDLASKIYLVETDSEWIEALKWTFAEYSEKVVVVNKYAADYSWGSTCRLDDVIQEKVDFMKLDIEGCEPVALEGACNLIHQSPDIKIVACTYHNDGDAGIIKGQLAEKYNMKCQFSKGYMFFPGSEQQRFYLPTLRRGVIRAQKNIAE